METKKVVVLGAGTTGAFTCGLLASHKPDYQIINIYDDSKPIIGVGESTTPLTVQALQDIGVTDEFLESKICWPKYGVEFLDWNNKPMMAGWSQFPDSKKGKLIHLIGLTDNKLLGRLGQTEDINVIPYDELNNRFVGSIGLHIDARYSAEIIFNKISNKIKRIAGTVEQVQLSDQGIDYVVVNGERIEADLWIDCSGMARAFISNFNLDVEESFLPMDSAVFFQTVEPQEKTFSLYTTAKCSNAGWMWTIPFENRLGAGHVYNSNFIDEAEAVKSLREFTNTLNPKYGTAKFKPSWLLNAYQKNVVAIGLASGFLDALDANTIHITLQQIYNLIELEDDREVYNRKNYEIFKEIDDYILLHYTTTEKNTDFWKTVPQKSNEELISLWEQALTSDTRYTGYREDLIMFVIASKINIPKDIVYKHLRSYNKEEIRDTAKEYREVSNKFTSFSYELFSKHLKWKVEQPRLR